MKSSFASFSALLAILAIACSQAHSSEASSPLSDLIAGPLLDSKGKEVDKKVLEGKTVGLSNYLAKISSHCSIH